MNDYFIAVLDIGKTNKKLVLYNSDLQIVEKKVTRIEEIEKDEIRQDNLEAIRIWVIEELTLINKKYPVKVISISAHGATCVCIDDSGKLPVPCISYTHDPGEDFHNEFFENFGSRIELQQTTGTPDFNLLLNVAKAIYYLKINFSEEFNSVRHILNLNQYFGYMLTGITGAEPTYIGSHTYLWDFKKGYWSEVADKLGIKSLLPEHINRPWDVLGRITPEIASKTGISKEAIVTYGIHDSNAALLPYLITRDKDFVLNSTGTWCVIMHERDEIHFNEDELGKVVFFNISAFSKPVKTSIFMGGAEYDVYNDILTNIHGDRQPPVLDLALIQKIIDEKSCFIMPGITKGTGQFPESEARIIENGRVIPFDSIIRGEIIPDCFNDRDKAFTVLNLSMAIQTKVSLDRSDMKDGIPLFIEGGFSKNDIYTALLTLFYPSSEIVLTNLDEASAFGAAIIGKSAMENKEPHAFKDHFKIEKIPVRKIFIPEVWEYYDKFMELV